MKPSYLYQELTSQFVSISLSKVAMKVKWPQHVPETKKAILKNVVCQIWQTRREKKLAAI
jgi:hypothetical protein